MAKIFGFKIFEPKDIQEKNIQQLPKDENLDGAFDLGSFGSYNNIGLTFNDEPIEDENVLINKYRELSEYPVVQKAINNVINQAFSYDEDVQPVKILFDNDSEVSDKLKIVITEEFDEILNLLNFKNEAYEIFKKWYVDGRLYYFKVIDKDNPNQGILELNYIDPRKIKKVRETDNNLNIKEYFVYNNMGITSKIPNGDVISPDSVAFIHSGLFDKTNSIILSYLNQAIKPYNQLRLIEDSLVVYRLSRASEKRVFNVEAGRLPPPKAESFLANLINQYRNKITYDPSTGNLKNNKRIISMQEDFWFLKRDGKGTTVDILQEGQNLGELQDVEYFKNILYESLLVPSSRFKSDTGFNIGRSSEISRDEIEFMKFISRLRKRFALLFDDILKTQLILKNIIKIEEWHELKNNFFYNFLEDNHFTELKNAEILRNRIDTYNNSKSLIDDGFISKAYIRKNVLHIDDNEWEQIQEEIKEDKQNIEKEEQQKYEKEQQRQQKEQQQQQDQDIDNIDQDQDIDNIDQDQDIEQDIDQDQDIEQDIEQSTNESKLLENYIIELNKKLFNA